MTNSLSVSPRSRPEVGSSRIRNGGSVVSARAISTICRSSKARLRTDASRPIRRPRRSKISRAEASMRRRSTKKRFPGSRPSHILRDIEVRDQPRVLIDHRNPVILRIARARELDGLLVEQDLSRRWAEDAGENTHERRLARAVLADKPMDLAATDIERGPLQRLNARKAFFNSDDAKRRSGIAHVERLSVKDLGEFGV